MNDRAGTMDQKLASAPITCILMFKECIIPKLNCCTESNPHQHSFKSKVDKMFYGIENFLCSHDDLLTTMVSAENDLHFL